MTDNAKLVALEAECSRNLTSTKCWVALVRATVSARSAFTDAAAWANAVNVLFERALRAIPYSYKLWWQYLRFRLDDTASLCAPNEWFQGIREVFERAVETLPRMPLLWCAYLQFVQSAHTPRITMMRHLIVRALNALPATQHHHIWKIATTWASGDHIPSETFKSVWRLYLLFKPSIETQRQYFARLARREDPSELIDECVAFVRARRAADASDESTEDDNEEASEGLEKSPEFWETIREVFQTPNWVYRGNPADLDDLVETGTRYAASPADLDIAYAVCLYGQGRVLDGRARLHRLMDSASDPAVFHQAYRTAMEVEDQLLESFALSPELNEVTDASYHAVETALFGGKGAALTELERLAEQFPLWMNQCQLRQQPTNVALWLKRLELVEERTYAGLSTVGDCVALCQQSIAQCTTGVDVVDCAVGELYDQFARLLVNAGRPREAVTLLSTAAWHVRFASVSINMLLLGRLVELKLAFADKTPVETLAYLMERLTAKPSSSAGASSDGAAARLTGYSAAQRRHKEGFVTTNKEAPLAHVQAHVLAWLLAADVALSYESADGLRTTLDTFANSTAYTAESACYVAHGLFMRGDSHGACAELERGVARFHGQPVALSFILTQYLSLLSAWYGQRVPLHRFRELARLALDVLPAVLTEAPVMAVQLVTACAAVETQIGLYGHALTILQQLCDAAMRYADHNRYEPLVEGTLEVTICFAFQSKGIASMREVCARLLRLTPRPSLTQRIALQWIGIERAAGNADKAHQIFDACADSQDPRTAHGAVYWRLWESTCVDVKQLEEVARRRQQVVTAYQKKTG